MDFFISFLSKQLKPAGFGRVVLGGIYPAGLVIGVVSSVVRPEEATFCRVRIEPAVNFNSIEELFVLRALQP